METQRFELIKLGSIRTNPLNPRKCFEGEGFDNLVASVKEKGVLEPVLVRSVDGNGTFELVAGERRYRASIAAHLESIPAIVRPLDDDAAFEVMTIENLQREDISEIEEARSFQAWLSHKGEKAIPDLAKRIGSTPQYIRRRVRLLALPKEALAAWEKGTLTYSHLEELCRVSDKKRIIELAENVIRYEWSTKALRNDIDRGMIEISRALFDTKACKKCASNTLIQKDLFGFDAGGKKARCTDVACFKKEQNNWLMAHWPETAIARKYHTNGFRFAEAMKYDGYEYIYGPYKDCEACDKYVNLINNDGTIYTNGAVCADPPCHRRLNAQNTKKDPASGKSVPRHEWHGREFRERYYRERLPEICKTTSIIDERIFRTAIAAMIEHCNRANNYFREKYAPSVDSYRFYTRHAWDILETLDYSTLVNIFTDISALAIVDWGGQGDLRNKVAAHWGIELQRDWRITREYLTAKTIQEIIELGNALGIFQDPVAQQYLAGVLKRKSIEACKKSELLALILESGVDLAGKVPQEILDTACTSPESPPAPCGEPCNFCEYCGVDLGDEDECMACAGMENLDVIYCMECGTYLNEDDGACPQCDG